MVYTTQELLGSGETQYSIAKKLKDGLLHLIERGYYTTDSLMHFRDEVFLTKRYPFSILTGLSAFYIYDLTDHIPDYFYLATEQHSYPLRRDDVKQSYQEESFFKVGVIEKEIDGGTVRTYDLERLLIELIRLKEKYPKEIYYEVLNAFRARKNEIDFFKLNDYLKHFSNGNSLLERIKEVI